MYVGQRGSVACARPTYLAHLGALAELEMTQGGHGPGPEYMRRPERALRSTARVDPADAQGDERAGEVADRVFDVAQQGRAELQVGDRRGDVLNASDGAIESDNEHRELGERHDRADDAQSVPPVGDRLTFFDEQLSERG